jgi:hypothetical protein
MIPILLDLDSFDLAPENCTITDVSFPWLKDYIKINQGGICEATIFGVADFIGSERG